MSAVPQAAQPGIHPIPLHSPVAEHAHDVAVARKDILRIATAGSVDDGKSTLIGRLLYDS
jgi:bifunctional enzyme CysN/CysC